MKLFAISASLYVASAAMSLLADVSPVAGEVAPWAQLGTAGALAWVVSLLIGELRASRTDNAKQREEFNVAFKGASDRWHAEAERDRTVMMEMVQTCSANRRTAFEQDAHRDAAKHTGKSGG